MTKNLNITDEDIQLISESLKNTLKIFEEMVIDYKDWNNTKEDGFIKFNQKKCNVLIEHYEKRVIQTKTILEELKN